MRHRFKPTGVAKIKGLQQDLARRQTNQNLHTLAKWDVAGTATLQNSLAVHRKVNRVTLEASNSAHRYTAKRNENMDPKTYT